MNRPSDEELEIALDAAARMREWGVDPHHVAHVMLYLDQRNQRLNDVVRRVDRYVRFGLPERELTQLRRLIQDLREDEDRLDTESSELNNSMLL
jgi:hypothetical protein